ncbi:hypothetical protein [Paraliomyxa miuraensis]|uniref:hypothetical protein n=1 Tax=Paraliomyxa miuraensis TaxID=376150 RepID=UPI002259506B|nr:hypothetical protein [Paraliomyxa miuraensis]MCX4241806.1 hypothetical protein [Paraliomyxa miuraensis]
MTIEQRCVEYRERMLDTANSVHRALVAMAGDHEGIISDAPIRAVREVVFAELAEIKARLDELQGEHRSGANA